MTTGSDLLFLGTSDGYVEALDAKNGNLLWRFNVGSGVHGGIISYQVDGKQYIAAATGHGTYVGGAVQALNKDKIGDMAAQHGGRGLRAAVTLHGNRRGQGVCSPCVPGVFVSPGSRGGRGMLRCRSASAGWVNTEGVEIDNEAQGRSDVFRCRCMRRRARHRLRRRRRGNGTGQDRAQDHRPGAPASSSPGRRCPPPIRCRAIPRRSTWAKGCISPGACNAMARTANGESRFGKYAGNLTVFWRGYKEFVVIVLNGRVKKHDAALEGSPGRRQHQQDRRLPGNAGRRGSELAMSR